ncbi:MAG: hypothetical protein M3198_12650 [Actinomycetota bacterium]|nr:hypothetical protein [Actinomycetota bacterium]
MKWVCALLLSACLVFSACGGDDEETSSDSAATEAPTSEAPTEEATAEDTTAPDDSSDAAQRLEEEAKPSYISSCTAGGAPASVCECAWDGLTEAYPPEKLIELLEAAGAGETPTELLEKQQEIVQECA